MSQQTADQELTIDTSHLYARAHVDPDKFFALIEDRVREVAREETVKALRFLSVPE